jgi:tyrosine-specific transport protein
MLVKKMNSFTRTTSGLGLIVGVIVGAGMFALPYAVTRAGIFWSVTHLIITFSIITVIHVLYGTVVQATPGKHRLPGYARIYLGAWAGRLSLLSAFGGFYGALLVYGILGGTFLSRIIPYSLGSVQWTLLFFAAGAVILLCNLRRIGEINFLLTLLLIAFVGILVVLALPHSTSVSLSASDNAAWFLPYGLFLFAFAGASAIPDAGDMFRNGEKDKKLFRRVLILSTIIPLLIYIVFIGTVLGVSGVDTTPEAILGLERVLGARAVMVGSFVGFLAVFTSFLALSLDLKNIYRYDLQWQPLLAWVAVISIPVVLFLAGITDFVRVIGFVGAGAIGFDGVIILLSSLRVCKKGNRCTIGRFSFHPALPIVLIIALLAGVVYELFTIIGILHI